MKLNLCEICWSSTKKLQLFHTNNNKATTKDINVQLLKDYIEKEQTKRNERLAKKIKNERRVKFPSNNSDDLITMLVNNHLEKQKIEQTQEKTDEFLQHRLEYIQKVRKHVLPNTKVRHYQMDLQTSLYSLSVMYCSMNLWTTQSDSSRTIYSTLWLIRLNFRD